MDDSLSLVSARKSCNVRHIVSPLILKWPCDLKLPYKSLRVI